MKKFTFESKNLYTATEPAACGGYRTIIHTEDSYQISTDDIEGLIWSLNPTKELLENMLMRLEGAA
ncbi:MULTISPECIES: hypothetical protein [Providencia]|uniref:hypothetical protein n=1 Tax=Providencia TaxID=586 RepID=UPI001980DEF1|nr:MULTISPECIES: hypothetical protein [Providencia]MBN4867665.1 hypothetical protein [Providencia stuartii]MBN4877169.1 hypothetical protein [Providencia stuartii]MBN4881674.1 hypothetical protein [Providencia stuartii]MBN4886176.1 hypothetical protein [Providencia stuartii]